MRNSVALDPPNTMCTPESKYEIRFTLCAFDGACFVRSISILIAMIAYTLPLRVLCGSLPGNWKIANGTTSVASVDICRWHAQYGTIPQPPFRQMQIEFISVENFILDMCQPKRSSRRRRNNAIPCRIWCKAQLVVCRFISFTCSLPHLLPNEHLFRTPSMCSKRVVFQLLPPCALLINDMGLPCAFSSCVSMTDCCIWPDICERFHMCDFTCLITSSGVE